jgi:predicted RND superfamily exporter protein
VPASARKPSAIVDDVLEETVYIPAQDASSLISQYYLQYENGAKPTENLSALLTPDRSVFRISARIDAAPTSTTLAAFDRIREIAREHFPDIAGSKDDVASGAALSSLTLTGKQYLFTNMMDRFTTTLIVSFSLALSVIVVLITVVFRSIRLGLASLIPNVLPIAAPLGFLGLVGIPIDGPAILVASVALGVCVDDTIHLFAKFAQARGDGLSVSDSLERAFRLVGGALTWTTVVLVIGFGTLTLSSFQPNAAIGYMGSIMIALAWLADFLLVPAVMGYLYREETP